MSTARVLLPAERQIMPLLEFSCDTSEATQHSHPSHVSAHFRSLFWNYHFSFLPMQSGQFSSMFSNWCSIMASLQTASPPPLLIYQYFWKILHHTSVTQVLALCISWLKVRNLTSNIRIWYNHKGDFCSVKLIKSDVLQAERMFLIILIPFISWYKTVV